MKSTTLLNRRVRPRGLKILALAAAALLVAIPLAPVAAAQSTSGSLDGVVVSDAGGVAVGEGFVVRITNERTGRVREATTSNDGGFSFSGVEPGTYAVAVSGPGGVPRPAVRVRIVVGQRRFLAIVSDPGQATSDAAVTSAAAAAAATPPPTDDPQKQQPQTQPTPQGTPTPQPTPAVRGTRAGTQKARSGQVSTTTQGATFTEEEIDRSSDSNQRFSRLTQQTPGAVDAAGSGSALDTTINGVRREQNVVLIDGADLSSPVRLFQSDSVQEGISPYRIERTIGNIQEFRVAANTYEAVFGTGSGAQIVAITKGGGKEFKATLFENFRNSALNARNFFDTEEPPFQQNVFGARLSGPISEARGGQFFYASYEGARARPGYELFEAVPSAAARARAAPSIRPVLDAFVSPAATVVPGASTDPDNFDIVRLVSKGTTENNVFDLRFDFSLREDAKRPSVLSVRFLSEQPTTSTPEGVSGRRQFIRDTTQNLLANHNHTLSDKTRNEFRFYTNLFRNNLEGRPPQAGEGLSRHAVVLSGSAPYSNSPQLPVPLGLAVAGGLLRQSANGFSGSLYTFRPRTFAFADQVTRTWSDKNKLIFGGEIRFQQTEIDRLNGTTYTFGTLEDLLQNRLQSAQFTGDLGSPSPFGGGVAPGREARQEYYIGFVQDEWRPREDLALNVGLRYEYYSVVRERLDRNVIIDPTTGAPLPADTSFFKSPRHNFMPRVSFAWAPVVNSNESGLVNIFPFILRANFGIHTGPKGFLDQIQPIENDRINFTQQGGSYPIAVDDLIAGFFGAASRQYQPSLYAPGYNVSDRAYKYEVSFERVLGDNFNEDPQDQVRLVAAYVGNTSRQLLVRGFTNRIVEVQTNPDPTQAACVRRQFDAGACGGTLLQPFGELELRSSNGRGRYDALQLTVDGKWKTRNLSALKAQYTLSRNYGNAGGTPASNPFDLDEDLGYNPDDARHVFTFNTTYGLPFGREERFFGRARGLTQLLVGKWTVDAVVNLRTGKPIDVRLSRPDVVYVDAAGTVFGSPGAGRAARLNTPGGGSTFGLRRPDLVPGVSPFLGNDRAFLNPAAFAIPAPGTFGNLRRGQLHGPALRQVDLAIRKEVEFTLDDKTNSFEFRVEFFNLFNTANFRNPFARLPGGLGTLPNQLQPGQPFNTTVTNVFGQLNSTERYKDLGGSRQVQFRLLFHFNEGIRN